MSHCDFFFNDTATTEIYTLSLHDALPISSWGSTRTPTGTSTPPRTSACSWSTPSGACSSTGPRPWSRAATRSEEHTSELQSRQYLVCRLLLEKKKNNQTRRTHL